MNPTGSWCVEVAAAVTRRARHESERAPRPAARRNDRGSNQIVARLRLETLFFDRVKRV